MAPFSRKTSFLDNNDVILTIFHYFDLFLPHLHPGRFPEILVCFAQSEVRFSGTPPPPMYAAG